MKIVKNAITDYYSANFTEDEELWLVSGEYDNGQILRWGHYLYQYAGISGTNSEYNPIIDVDQWEYYRVSNYSSMLLGGTSEQTEFPETIEIEFDIVRFDTIALLRLDADEVIIEITDTATSTVLQTNTYDLSYREVYSYTDYFFAPFIFNKRLFLNIPFYIGARAKVTINKPGGIAKIGRLVAGRSISLGITLFGVTSDLTTTTKQTVTDFGTVVEEADTTYYTHNFSLIVESGKVEYLKDLRRDLSFVPLLFVGDEQDNSKFQNLLSFGTWESSSIPLDNASKSNMNLIAKELT